VSISFFITELGAELIAIAITLHAFFGLMGCWIVAPYLRDSPSLTERRSCYRSPNRART
jgi:hypothetical protein